MRVIYLSPSPAWREWNRSSKKGSSKRVPALPDQSRRFPPPGQYYSSALTVSRIRPRDGNRSAHSSAVIFVLGGMCACVAEGKTGMSLASVCQGAIELGNASFGLTSGTIWPVVRSRLILLTGAGLDTAQVYIKETQRRKPWVWGLFLMH